MTSVLATIIAPSKYLGTILGLCNEKRGVQRSAANIDENQILLEYDLPLCEVIVDFHDILKTLSSGYASFDYEANGYQESYLVKVNF